ncbi:WD repeat-containing protein [Drosera capensis]
MRTSYSDDDEIQFYDASEEIAIESDPSSLSIEEVPSTSGSGVDSLVQNIDLWLQSPESVHRRRSKFLNWFGSSVSGAHGIDFVDRLDSDGEFDRITWSNGAVPRSSAFKDDVSLTMFSMSCPSNDSLKSFNVDNIRQFESSDGRTLSGSTGPVGDRYADEDEKAGSGSSFTEDLLDRSSDSSSWLEYSSETKPTESGNLADPRKKVKKWWINKLRSFSCVMEDQSIGSDTGTLPMAKMQRMRVRCSRKKPKELSALYSRQDFQAHRGSILSMKFSLDGQYLASSGEDRIVRLWLVVEDERSSELDIPDIDPSCVYFIMNYLSELKPFTMEKEKRSLRKTSDSACVVIPPKIFRLLEKPLHEFRGHEGKILELSWSKNNDLLSSSVDNTVRLWRVGSNSCLKVFLHDNYVTCVQFNPVDDNYFISGSIDGKVRIWEVSDSHVVYWADIKDIVTAVSYSPDGKGGIIGTLTGCCRLYNVSGNNLQLDSQICLHSRKKKSCRKITAFQYLPQDPKKVMVTCADSRIRILHGTTVIGKYKGSRKSANYVSASFTYDGKHILSACEDSNVYMWNCMDHGTQAHSQVRKISSSERFPSNASIAIPWFGLRNWNKIPGERQVNSFSDGMLDSLPISPCTCFTRSQDCFLESYPKGSATWPKEKLTTCTRVRKMGRVEYKFLKNSFLTSYNSHAWGLVIVTGGWDGRIRSFINYGLPTS